MINTAVISALQVGPINWTVLLAVLTLSLAAMGTLTKIFSKPKDEFLPGKSDACSNRAKELARTESKTAENAKKISEFNVILSDIRTEVAVLKNSSINSEKTADELKKSNRELAQKIDALLKQLLEWVKSS